MAFNQHTDNETELPLEEFWARREKKVFHTAVFVGRRADQFATSYLIRAKTPEGAIRTARSMYRKSCYVHCRLADPVTDLGCKITKTRPVYL